MYKSVGINKFEYIDLLRGFAILGVIAVHSHQKISNLDEISKWLFNYGQLGVQLFFVASALTLCLSMNQRKENNYSNFYIRRFFRIAPLYYLAIIIYFSWSTFKNYVFEQKIQINDSYNIISIFENIFFVHGFDPRYFNSVVPGGWSIATEMVFYLIFPILFILQSKLNNKQFIVFLILISVISFVSQFIIIQNIQPYLFENGFIYKILLNNEFGFIYASIINQINVFIIGILAYRYLDKEFKNNYLIFIGIIFCLIACYFLNTSHLKTNYNGYIYPILSAIGFCIFVIKLSKFKEFKNFFLKKIILIGKFSFSMYIFHFLILDILSFILNRTIFKMVDISQINLFFLFLCAVFFTYNFAKISYKLIEEPGIELGKKIIGKKIKLPIQGMN